MRTGKKVAVVLLAMLHLTGFVVTQGFGPNTKTAGELIAEKAEEIRALEEAAKENAAEPDQAPDAEISSTTDIVVEEQGATRSPSSPTNGAENESKGKVTENNENDNGKENAGCPTTRFRALITALAGGVVATVVVIF